MTLQPISLERCSYCEKPSDELVTYVDGVSICLACRTKEQARIAAVEAEYRAVYGDSPLAAWQAEGR